MRQTTTRRADSSRPSWVLPASRRAGAFERGSRDYRWRARAPVLRRIVRAAVVFLAAAARSAHAAFDTPTISAQAAAMGGASLAGQGGDSAALFLNPAAGAGLVDPEAYFMYNQLFAGLSGVGGISQGFAAFGAPTTIGTVGAGFGDFQASGLLDERVVGVTFARRWLNSFEAGVTGKYLYHRYLIGADALAGSDPVFRSGTARGAFALDAGLIVPVSDVFHVGLAVRNINQPDVGLAVADRVPRQVQAGLRYDLKPYDLRLTADYAYSAAPAGTLSYNSHPGVGLEKGFEDGRLKIRVGLTPDEFSAGIGLQFGCLGFDYAFLLSRTLLANSAGTQMVGIRYRFGDAAASAARSQ